jgi:hypothetical protein
MSDPRLNHALNIHPTPLLRRKKSTTKLQKLFSQAWRVWSVHIRSSSADWQGYTECWTCRKKYPWKELHAGHYHHGRLDFDPLNIHPQCVRCNLRLHGNLGAYSERLIEEYGPNAIKRLRIRANTVHKYTIPELESVIKRYESHGK